MEPATNSLASRTKERERDDRHTVGSAVGELTGGHHDPVREAVTESLLEPVKVTDVLVAGRGRHSGPVPAQQAGLADSHESGGESRIHQVVFRVCVRRFSGSVLHLDAILFYKRTGSCRARTGTVATARLGQNAGMSGLRIPVNLREGLRTYPDETGQSWLEELPAVVAGLASRWSLTVGEVFEPGGWSSWTAAATASDGTECVLKVGRPHPEARDEAHALRLWDGRGAVRLLAEAPESGALLLERCRPGVALATRPYDQQDGVLSELLPRLWVSPPPGHPFRPLARMCAEWADAFEAEPLPAGLDPATAGAAARLLRTLPASASRQVLLGTDTHAGNVLSAHREPWLVIDPKPYVGDPAYDAVQHLLNCPELLEADAVVRSRSSARSTRPLSRDSTWARSSTRFA